VMGIQDHKAQSAALIKWTKKTFGSLKFQSRPGKSAITVPILFRA